MTMSLKAPEIRILRKLLILVIFLTMACGAQCIKCRYINRVGSTYRLKCNYFDKREPVTAHNLVLSQYDNGVKRIIPSTQYLIVDKRTIELVWQNIPRINTQIECYYRDERKNINRGIFVKNVWAETPPEEIENFQCISYDFQYLKCSFDKTKQFQTETIISPSECKQKNDEENVCILSQPSYDSAKRQYNFTISSKNCFGERNQSFSIYDLGNVVPGKPNVSLASIRSNSAILTLTVHNELYKEKGLMYEINLWKESADLPISLNTSQLDPKCLHNSFLITHLKAFRSYKVEVRAQSRGNNIVDRDMWGPAVEVIFKTLAKAPDRPPKVDVGSFFVDSKHRIHIFWETLPERDHNGSNFGYEIFEVKRNGEKIREVTSNSHLLWNTFTTMYELPKGNYEFSIRSINDNGTSPAAVLRVPEIASPRPRKVRSFYKDGNYTICWNPPQADQVPQNYTVFNCVSDGSNDATNKCSENFRSVVVPVYTKCMTFTSNKNLQFAVSANYHEASSGMVWVDCIPSYESDVGEVSLTSPYVKNNSTISLEWSLNCSQKSLVTGYTIRYCRRSVDANDCINKTINADAETVDLIGLLPNTEYDIRIALCSEATNGRFSKSVTAKTSERVPTAPKNLVLCGITRNTVYLKWERPDELNGQLHHYKVWFNKEWVEITAAGNLNANVSYTLQNLKYNHVYNISVVAGTKLESEKSNVIRVRTGSSDPATASRVRFQSISSNSYNIIWQPDIETFSPVKGYEIKIENTVKNQSRSRIANSNETFLEETFNCSEKTEEYQVYIRVVSVDVQILIDECTTESLDMFQTFSQIKLTDILVANGSAVLDRVIQREGTFARIMYGNWSASAWYTCEIASSSLGQVATIVACSVILVVALLFLIWNTRRRIVIAKNIILVLPPALQPHNASTQPDSPTKYSLPSSGTTDTLTAAKSEESRLLFNDEKCNGFDEEYASNQSAFGSLTCVQLEELCETEDDEVPTYLPMENKRDFPATLDGYILHNALDSNGMPLETCERTSKFFGGTPPDIRTKDLKHLDSNGYISLRDVEKKLMAQNLSNKPDAPEPKNSFTTNEYIRHDVSNVESVNIASTKPSCSRGVQNDKSEAFDASGYLTNRKSTAIKTDASDKISKNVVVNGGYVSPALFQKMTNQSVD